MFFTFPQSPWKVNFTLMQACNLSNKAELSVYCFEPNMFSFLESK